MEQRNLSIFTKILAIFLFIIGIAGIILPILPGWPFIFLALFIWGGTALLDRKILKYLPDKYRQKVINWLEKYDKSSQK